LIADQAIRMEKGRLVRAGAPREVLARGFDDPLASSGADDMLLRLCMQDHDRTHGVSRARCGAVPLEVPLSPLAVGEEFVVALAARDIVLAAERPHAVSARNILPATIDSIRQHGETWIAELEVEREFPKLSTTLTTGAVLELGLAAGRSVWVLFKSSALRRLL
jgi:molybdate transport system ATP-binding protein